MENPEQITLGQSIALVFGLFLIMLVLMSPVIFESFGKHILSCTT